MNSTLPDRLVRVPKTPLQMAQREFPTLEISANTDTSLRQRGEAGLTPIPIPPLKQTNMKSMPGSQYFCLILHQKAQSADTAAAAAE